MLAIKNFIWMYHNEHVYMTNVQTSVFTAPRVYLLNSCTPQNIVFVDSNLAGMKKVRIQPAERQKRGFT